MQSLRVGPYSSDDVAKLAEFILHYRNIYPDAKLLGAEFYTHHPALAGGQHVLCVCGAEQRLVGFAPLFPPSAAEVDSEGEDQLVWTVLLALPDIDNAGDVRELLYGAMIAKVSEWKRAHGLSRLRLVADMMVSQKADIDFLRGKGFEPQAWVHIMGRDMAQIIRAVTAPAETTMRQLKLDTEEEQTSYVLAHNRCFPTRPTTVEELRFLLESPAWESGTVIAAVDPSGQSVGHIMMYRDSQTGPGVLDDVMVVPEWRGQGIAKSLIGEALRIFRDSGVSEVRLEVLEDNAPAVAAYAAMGFRVINREVILGKVV